MNSKPLLCILLSVIALTAFAQKTKTTSKANPPAIVAPAPPSPAALTTAQLQGLKYRFVGPSRGGRSTAVDGVRQEPNTFYMGATGGGVWKTTDAGLTWSNISDQDIKTASVGAIAVAPSDPNVVYVGMGSADPRGNVIPGDGLYRSTDAGAHWKPIGLEKAGQIGKIVVHPQNPDWLTVAVLGNVFGPSEQRGIFRSKDGGKTWEKILYVSNKTGAIELVADPGNPRILYAGFWTAERKSWTFIDGSAEGGIWKSLDGGDTWEKLGGGLPTGVVGRVGIAVSPTKTSRVWVQIEALEETKGGLYRSDDGGKTFTRVCRDHSIRQRAWYYSRIYADPKDENTVYNLNVSFMKSIDGGKTFTRISVPHGDTHVLWINPDNPNLMVQGNDGGACVTLNGGRTWSSQLNQPTTEFYRLTLDNQFPYRLYSAQQDNSTISIPSRFDPALTPQEQWREVGGGESGHIAVDPRNPNIVYAGNYIGQITKTDLSRGHRRDVVAYPQMHDGTAPRDIRYRFQWNAPIRVSPHNPDVVYHCSQYVHRSPDAGRTWEVISPDLTTNNDKYHDIPGGPIQHDHTGVELYTTIFAFEESPQTAGELWAGSDDGRVHLSRDNGKTWQNITPGNIPVDGTVNMIELSAHAAGRALIAVHKYRENDFKPYIFLTNNYGQSWTLLTDGKNGIPADHYVKVVREDPSRKGLLYAGTEYGVWVSFDEGKNWQPFQFNLPPVSIADMAIKEKDLVLATHGRGFWILDDVSPLHSIPTTVQAEVTLFKPRDAYRNQFSGFRGAGAPDRAPNGAIFHYFIKNKIADTAAVKLSIIDPQGKVRKVYSSNPKDGQEVLRTQVGLNRLEWDLTYEGPEALSGAQFSLADMGAVKAMPGQHKLVLEYRGSKQEQALLVKKDPRWTQTDADLQAQYDLTMQVKELFNTCHATIADIRSWRSQIKDVMERSDKYKSNVAKAIKTAGDPLVKTLTEWEEKLIQTKSEVGQDPINYPSQIDDQMAYLYSIVNNQDDRPNAGCYERLEDLKKAFLPMQNQLKAFKSTEIAAFNKVLQQQGLQLIMTKER
ncbi:MAG: glycosyl hydrolase [Haliscomenobacter sp.]|nr:sialidase family protein [Haliscomenobacter sp.]MBK9488936.1 glycosyl hydrolase [Haliscomenobacter sp.]